MGKAIGCHLIGTVGSDEKLIWQKKMVVNMLLIIKKKMLLKKVMEITGGKGVPVVYDGVGKDTFNISVDCLSNRGMFVSFGNASGMTPTGRFV